RIVVGEPVEGGRPGVLEAAHALPLLVLARHRGGVVAEQVKYVVKQETRVVEPLVLIQTMSAARKQRRKDRGLRVVRVGGGGPGGASASPTMSPPTLLRSRSKPGVSELTSAKSGALTNIPRVKRLCSRPR